MYCSTVSSQGQLYLQIQASVEENILNIDNPQYEIAEVFVGNGWFAQYTVIHLRIPN